jgi:hypothetical protein
VWREEYQRHAIGAFAIGALGVIVEEPHTAGGGYARLLDAKPRRVPEGLLVETGTAPIAFGSRKKLGQRLGGAALPTRAQPVVAALFIRVADRSRAADALARGGFAPVTLKDGSIAIGADQAHGIALVFG